MIRKLHFTTMPDLDSVLGEIALAGDMSLESALDKVIKRANPQIDSIMQIEASNLLQELRSKGQPENLEVTFA